MVGCYRRLIGVPVMLLIAVATVVATDHSSPSIDELNKTYGRKTAMLRGFYCGSHLEFDSSGKSIVVPDSGSWTECGFVEIKKFAEKKNQLQIEGTRIGITFDSGKFVPRAGAKIKISVQEDPGKPLDATAVLDEVFYGKESRLIDVVPNHWKCYVANPNLSYEALRNQCLRPKVNGETIAKVDPKRISPPVPKYDPDPEFTPFARMEHWQGTTLLDLEITPEGDVGDVFVVRPLGLGLDDAAVNAVKKWKFNPSRRVADQTAVRVSVVVEVNFHMDAQPLKSPGSGPTFKSGPQF